MIKYILSLLLVLLLSSTASAQPAQALIDAEAPQAVEEEFYVDTFTGNPLIIDMMRRAIQVDKVELPDFIPSVFFTPREQNLIENARKGVVARVATDSELMSAQENDNLVPKGPREISVSGILYVGANDWTVWLNDKKITPDRLPSEITDIKVGKDYVKLKWFDAYTNQIYPIKLKSHQRFNLDTRIFLPG